MKKKDKSMIHCTITTSQHTYDSIQYRVLLIRQIRAQMNVHHNGIKLVLVTIKLS